MKQSTIVVGALTSALLSATAHAWVFKGTFTGTVVNSHVGLDRPDYHGQNIDGTQATGSFYFDTHTAELPVPPEQLSPSDWLFAGQDARIALNIPIEPYGYPIDDSPFTTLIGLHSDSSGQSFSIQRTAGFEFISLNFAGAANSLFTNFDQHTFNPLNIDLAHSGGSFLGGRAYNGAFTLDSITFDGYGTINVPEPQSAGLLCAGLALLAISVVANLKKNT